MWCKHGTEGRQTTLRVKSGGCRETELGKRRAEKKGGRSPQLDGKPAAHAKDAEGGEGRGKREQRSELQLTGGS